MERHLSETLIEELAENASEVKLDQESAEHLESCDQCRDEIELARMLCQSLEAVPRMIAPASLYENIMREIAHKAQIQRQALIWTATSIFMALVIVILWLAAGGAATVTLEALDTYRSIEMASRIMSSLMNAIPIELFALCTVILMGSSAVLGRLIRRMSGQPTAQPEAG